MASGSSQFRPPVTAAIEDSEEGDLLAVHRKRERYPVLESDGAQPWADIVANRASLRHKVETEAVGLQATDIADCNAWPAASAIQL